jgi:hypothetical protein
MTPLFVPHRAVSPPPSRSHLNPKQYSTCVASMPPRLVGIPRLVERTRVMTGWTSETEHGRLVGNRNVIIKFNFSSVTFHDGSPCSHSNTNNIPYLQTTSANAWPCNFVHSSFFSAGALVIFDANHSTNVGHVSAISSCCTKEKGVTFTKIDARFK